MQTRHRHNTVATERYGATIKDSLIERVKLSHTRPGIHIPLVEVKSMEATYERTGTLTRLNTSPYVDVKEVLGNGPCPPDEFERDHPVRVLGPRLTEDGNERAVALKCYGVPERAPISDW
jgi:hypothetical protein